MASAIHRRGGRNRQRFPELPGVGGAYDPALSPDSRYVAFFDFSTNLLKHVSVLGGTPADVSPISGAETRGIAWGGDDTVFFATTPPSRN